MTPNINNVYRAFKNYAEEKCLQTEVLLADLLRYARFFEKLLTCRSGLEDERLDACLYRMMRLGIVVTRPCVVVVFSRHKDGNL